MLLGRISQKIRTLFFLFQKRNAAKKSNGMRVPLFKLKCPFFILMCRLGELSDDAMACHSKRRPTAFKTQWMHVKCFSGSFHVHPWWTNSFKNLSDSSVDCSLVFVASFQARSSVNQSCPLATVMCCVRENHSFNPVMSLLDKMDRFIIPFSSGDLPTSWVSFSIEPRNLFLDTFESN